MPWKAFRSDAVYHRADAGLDLADRFKRAADRSVRRPRSRPSRSRRGTTPKPRNKTRATTAWRRSSSKRAVAMALTSPPTAFNRLHASLQEALYRMKWTKAPPDPGGCDSPNLRRRWRPDHSARTAAGKNRGRLLANLVAHAGRARSRCFGQSTSVRSGLINDQFSRNSSAAKRSPVHKCTRRAASQKRSLLEHPSRSAAESRPNGGIAVVNHAHRSPQFRIPFLHRHR